MKAVGACRPRHDPRDGALDLSAALRLYPGHQGREVHRQRLGEPVDVHHADVPAPALDIADVARVEAGLLGEASETSPT